MPAAKGLFHRAIMQSGSGRANDRTHGAQIVADMLDALGPEITYAERLLSIPAEDMVEAQGKVVAKASRAAGLPFGPIQDGDTLPLRPIDAITEGVAADVPVLIGTNRDEIKLFAATTQRDEIDESTLEKLAGAMLPETEASSLRELIGTYRASRGAKGLPATNLDILDAIGSDVRFRVPALRTAEAQARHQPDTYVYLFTYASPARRGATGFVPRAGNAVRVRYAGRANAGPVRGHGPAGGGTFAQHDGRVAVVRPHGKSPATRALAIGRPTTRNRGPPWCSTSRAGSKQIPSAKSARRLTSRCSALANRGADYRDEDAPA